MRVGYFWNCCINGKCIDTNIVKINCVMHWCIGGSSNPYLTMYGLWLYLFSCWLLPIFMLVITYMYFHVVPIFLPLTVYITYFSLIPIS